MRRRLLAVVLAVLLLAGCATVPTKGTIRSGSRQGLAPELGGVGVEAKPPRDNLKAMQLVTGFLEAMSDSQAYDVARQYMTPEAAAAWKPESQTVVYDQQPGRAHAGGRRDQADGHARSPPSTTAASGSPRRRTSRPTSSSS